MSRPNDDVPPPRRRERCRRAVAPGHEGSRVALPALVVRLSLPASPIVFSVSSEKKSSFSFPFCQELHGFFVLFSVLFLSRLGLPIFAENQVIFGAVSFLCNLGGVRCGRFVPRAVDGET